MEKNDKKIIKGWVFYDWANSVYNLVVSSSIFPIFYDAITKARFAKSKGIEVADLKEGETILVSFFGMEMSSSVLFSFVLACSFLLIAFLSPLLSGIADYSGNKKRFMQFFSYLGSFACISLFFFKDVPLELGMLSVFFASIGFWNSLVFYNAFLPEIAPVEDHDKISAKGFIMGYFGSMILLIFCLVWMQVFHQPAEYCFLFVGIWWIGFSQVTFRVLPNNVYGKVVKKGILWRGFRELKIVFKEFKTTKRLKRFLFSFFFFNTGVQTVMLMATIFANREIDWPEGSGSTGLIIAILLIQIVGAIGAFLMSRLSRFIGNIKTLVVSVIIWLVICVMGMYVRTPVEFYLLASMVGLVMGGVQAMARSTYSKFLPEYTTDHASYFSFYDVTEKIGIVIGLAFFGIMEILTGSIRYSVLSVAFFFIIGLILLFFIPKEEVEMIPTHIKDDEDVL
jgi:MFS transporter, UMF1 family